jgi:hypothetical protein
VAPKSRSPPLCRNVRVEWTGSTRFVATVHPRRKGPTALIPFLETAPVSEKPVGLNRSPRRPGYGH